MIKSHDLLKYGAFAFLLATTIGFASVNSETLTLIPALRIDLLITSAISLLLYLGSLRASFAIFCAIAFFSIFSIYGVLRGLDNLQHVDFLQALVTSYAVVILGLFFFGSCRSQEQQYSIAINFLIFSIALIAFLFLTNGLELREYPRFNFDLYSDSNNQILYSQGISKFFSLAAIASIFVLRGGHSLVLTTVLQVLFVVFFTLAFIGGGRGDFLALIIVILAFFLLQSWGKLLLCFIGVFLVYQFGRSFLEAISSDIIAAQRFLVLFEVSNLGSRDFLFEGAIDILANEPKCFLLGCGFAYFQNYYGYEYGLYPHNLFLEALITWGAPLVTASFVLFIYGALKEAKSDFLTWVGVYFVLVSFKSGDLLGSWLALTFIFYYVGVGVSVLVRPMRKEQTGFALR